MKQNYQRKDSNRGWGWVLSSECQGLWMEGESISWVLKRIICCHFMCPRNSTSLTIANIHSRHALPIVSKNRSFIENHGLFTMKRCFHRWKRIFYENWPMILCEIRHVSRVFNDFPKPPMNVHDFKRSTSVFIDVFVTSVFTGDQRTKFTGFHPWCGNINDHRWLSGYITRENQCHQNLQDHPWYPLFVIHDHWLFDIIILQRKLDSCSCGSTSFYWYPRAPTRQFYKTFPKHLSRHPVRGCQWPVVNSRFDLRSTQSTDQASNAMKKYRKDRENEGTSQTTSLGDRFERISRRSCSTAPSTDCPSTLAEYFATQTGFPWSSRRTVDCSRDNALAETNAIRLLRRSLAWQRSVRFLWCWRWWSCRRFACRERSRSVHSDEMTGTDRFFSWCSRRVSHLEWTCRRRTHVDKSARNSGRILILLMNWHIGLSTGWLRCWSRSNGSSCYCKCAWPGLPMSKRCVSNAVEKSMARLWTVFFRVYSPFLTTIFFRYKRSSKNAWLLWHSETTYVIYFYSFFSWCDVFFYAWLNSCFSFQVLSWKIPCSFRLFVFFFLHFHLFHLLTWSRYFYDEPKRFSNHER